MTDYNKPIIAWLPDRETGELVKTGIVGREEIAMIIGWGGAPWSADKLHQELQSGNEFFDNCEVRYATEEERETMGLDVRRAKLTQKS